MEDKKLVSQYLDEIEDRHGVKILFAYGDGVNKNIGRPDEEPAYTIGCIIYDDYSNEGLNITKGQYTFVGLNIETFIASYYVTPYSCAEIYISPSIYRVYPGMDELFRVMMELINTEMVLEECLTVTRNRLIDLLEDPMVNMFFMDEIMRMIVIYNNIIETESVTFIDHEKSISMSMRYISHDILTKMSAPLANTNDPFKSYRIDDEVILWIAAQVLYMRKNNETAVKGNEKSMKALIAVDNVYNERILTPIKMASQN